MALERPFSNQTNINMNDVTKTLREKTQDLQDSKIFLACRENTLNSIIAYAEIIESFFGYIPLEIKKEINRDLEKYEEMYCKQSFLSKRVLIEKSIFKMN